MALKNVHTLTGDGAFGYVHEVCIVPFLQETAGDIIRNVEHDWSLMNRVRSDGKIVPESLQAIMQGGAASVKYPGATGTADELQFAVEITGVTPKTALGRGESPNAAVRGASGLDASILRPPARSAALIRPLETKWSARTDADIHTLEKGGRKANAKVMIAAQDGAVTAHFRGSDGIEQQLSGAGGDHFNLAKGSPVSLTHVDMHEVEKCIRASLDDAVDRGADVTLAIKNTVLKSVDAPILKKTLALFEAEYKAKFDAKGLKLQDVLVDDAFAFLLAKEWNHGKPLIMLSPDDCYGAQMKTVLSEVKNKGLNYDHTKHQIAVARLSNGSGDEYGGIHFTPKAAGTLVVKDAAGKEMCAAPVQKDEMWLVAAHDVNAAKTYANRMIDYALNNKIGGQETAAVYFGFDAHSPYEKPLVKAIEDVISARKNDLQKRGIAAEIRDPAKVAAQMLTSPPTTGTILALNNLWGDIMADLFPALANNKASYDSLLISDKGFMVETGAGGTAGDLIIGKKNQQGAGIIHTGKMPLNPIAILSGYAHAIRYKGEAAHIRYAEQLEEAIDATLKQGYLTGDLMSGGPQLLEKFITGGVAPQAVDTRVFVQAVKTNLLELQGKSEAKAARATLEDMKRKHDFAHPSLLTDAERNVAYKYITMPMNGATAADLRRAV